MDVFKKSPYYEAVDEPVLRLVQECMEEAKYSVKKLSFLNEDSVKGLIAYVVDQLQDQLPHSDRTGLGQLLTSLVVEGRQPLSNNTAVLNSGAASSVPKSGKKRKKTSEIYEDFVEGVIERVSDQSELNLPNLRTHIRKKFNHAQAAQGILFNDDGTRIGAADKAESDGEDKHADKDDGRSKTPATAAKANNDSSGSDDDA
ncbi:TPA: hypothetical protein ACH3X1_004686 [Trebouxia sp. C0004]